MPVIMISILAVAVFVGLVYCHKKGWNDINSKLSDRDTYRIWFLKQRYIPNLNSKRIQGVISEEEYVKELKTVEEEVEEMEARCFSKN